MSPDPSADLSRLRGIALALPRTAEKRSHGMPVFFIEKGRTFAWFSHNHHGNGITAAIVKTSGLDEQAMLIEAEPELFYRPAYLGPAGWVAIRLDRGATEWDHVAARVEASWQLVAPAKLRQVRDA